MPHCDLITYQYWYKFTSEYIFFDMKNTYRLISSLVLYHRTRCGMILFFPDLKVYLLYNIMEICNIL